MEPIAARSAYWRILGRRVPNVLCDYHRAKRDNLAMKLPVYCAPTDKSVVIVKPDTAILSALDEIDKDSHLAGSWQLMGEQLKLVSAEAPTDRTN